MVVKEEEEHGDEPIERNRNGKSMKVNGKREIRSEVMRSDSREDKEKGFGDEKQEREEARNRENGKRKKEKQSEGKDKIKEGKERRNDF